MNAPSIERCIQTLHAHLGHLRHTVAELNRRFLHYQDDLRLAHEQTLQEIAATFQLRQKQSQQLYRDRRQLADEKLRSAVDTIHQYWAGGSYAVPWVALPWDDPVWQEYTPQLDVPVPSIVRLGSLQLDAEGATASLGDLPAFVPLVGKQHLFIQGESLTHARDLWQTLLLRLVVTVPPHRLRLVLFDPANMGATLAPFLHLPPNLRGHKVFADPAEIGQQLEKLVDHIEYVIQTRLLNTYTTIEDYNEQTDAIAVPYHVVVLTDFPAGFDDRQHGGRLFERLLRIARNGPRAGVYLVAHLNHQYKLPDAVSLGDLTSLGQLLTLQPNEQFHWPLPDGRELPVLLDRLPSANLTNHWLAEIGRTLERVDTSLDYGRIAVPKSECWQRESLDALSVPIGIQSSGELHTLNLGQGMVHHGLIGGIIGSGKSNLLHVIIMQLALTYSPDELEFYLVDFKEGVEFQNYVHLPHVRAVGLESEREFGLSILHRLRDSMAERGQLFKEAGGLVSDITTYRLRTGERLPRIVLVMDEFQVLFGEDDSVARESARIIEDIARRGRAFGIHLLLSSQSPSMTGIYGSRIYNQIGLRIALRCRAQDAQAILGEGNEAASQLSQVGEAIYNADMGVQESNRFIRVALLTPEERLLYLQHIQALAVGRNDPMPITFAGRAPALLEENRAFHKALCGATWPDQKEAVYAWLGQPVEIKKPTAAPLERYVRANLLIVGGHETQGYGLLLSTLLSIAAQRRPQDAQFIVVDFARTASGQTTLFDSFTLPHQVDIVRLDARGTLTGSPLQTLTTLLNERLTHRNQPGPDVYLFIAGLQRWRDLMPAEAYSQSEAGKQLLRLAEEGPEVGIHLIVWADSFVTLERIFKRGSLSAFDLRVLLRLSEFDSNQLIGSPHAARLEDNRALFRHEDWEMRRVEKFKPYTIPSSTLLQQWCQELQSKAAYVNNVDLRQIKAGQK